MTTYGPPGDGPIAPARPWLGWLLAVVAISAGVLVTLGTLLLHFIGCVDGDGGVPYTAEDSPKAAVCSAAAGRLRC